MIITPVFDISRARLETPGCQNVLHFNNSGASLMPQPVLETVTQHLSLEAHQGGYEASNQNADLIENTYKAAASLINCQPEEIAFLDSATRAWCMVIYAFRFSAGDRILISSWEYVSNLIALRQISIRTGAEIVTIPNDSQGQIDIEALHKTLDQRVKLIALTHIPTNNGVINPAEEVGNIAKKAGIPFFLDACQSIGQIPIDVSRIGCDFLSATGRKYLRGPRGTGFLYVNKNWLERLEPPMLDWRSAELTNDHSYTLRPDARRFEFWESNIAAKIGLGTAIDYAQTWGMENIQKRIQLLSQELRQKLTDIPSLRLLDEGNHRCGIVTFRLKEVSPESILEKLRERKINIYVSQTHQQPVLRASIHYFNTTEEIGQFCTVLRSIKN